MSTFSWNLIESEETSTTTEEDIAAARAALRRVPAFFGRGITRPFRRDQKSDIANETGAALIAAGVGQILGTRAADDAGVSKGELPWRPDFGSLLHLLRHRNNRIVTREMARFYVMDCLAKWAPRVRVKSVIVEVPPTKRRWMIVHVRFQVIDLAGNVLLDDQRASVPLQTAA